MAHDAAPAADRPLSTVRALVGRHGVAGRPLRSVLALLTEGPHPLDSLVRATAVPRRTVEELLDALGTDLQSTSGGVAIRDDVRSEYRNVFGYDQLRGTELPDPLSVRLAQSVDLLARVREWVAGAPAARQELDHVAATPETVARRALWLDATFDLPGAHVLFVGDHDLTSLALCEVDPEVAVSVVDVDERLLEYLDRAARGVRCVYADLRFGLPPELGATADLVFTDPPYTPEGMALFLARAAQGIRDRENGRIVAAYGFSGRSPSLGLKVQSAIVELGLVVEAILPGFHRYQLAQAVGSSSDLYVCRPTSRTWDAIEHERTLLNIYTHGKQSLEGRARSLPPEGVAALVRIAAGPSGVPVRGIVAEAWPVTVAGPQRVRVATLLARGLPATLTRPGPVAVVVDLSDDPGPWLLRALLATNADRVAVLVPNNHPDIGSERAQRELAALVGPKYRLRFHRSTPTPQHAVVEAATVDRLTVARAILERAHGKVANSWREGLVQASAAHGRRLTKNEARAIVAARAAADDLVMSPMSLPRHRLVALIENAEASANDLPPTADGRPAAR